MITVKAKNFFKQLLLPLFLILSFLAGYQLSCFNLSKTSKQFQEIRLQSNYRFINPLLECDNANISQSTNFNFLKNKIDQTINQQIKLGHIKHASVYFRDLNNGPWFGIQEKKLFSPSSLIKVPLLIAYLKIAESNPEILNQKLVNTEPYQAKSQNIEPISTLAPNQTYTIKELLAHMIIYSDNPSYNLLNQNMPLKTLVNTYRDLGIDITQDLNNSSGDILSVKDYSSFFRILYNSSYLNRDMSEYALSLLAQSKFTQGLVAGIPASITVAHKFGERQYLDTGLKQLHDCGIIYIPQKPYLLCIMTQGRDFNQLTTVIGQISQQVYQQISSL